MRLYSTVCFRNWPRHYVTYYQETRAPYRRCDQAHVYRFLTFGLVVVRRWTTQAADADEALMYGLGARVIPVGPDFHHDMTEERHMSLRHKEP